MELVPDLTLLDVVPEVAELVDPSVLPQLRRFFGRSTVALDPGPWDDGAVPPARGAFGLVVLEGLLVRECTIEGRRCTEMLAPGDVAAPWIAATTGLPVDVTWRVAQPSRVAVLDRAFLAASTRWPGLTACIAARYGETCSRLAMHKAICQLPRVEDRVALVLWHLSERMGRVTGEGTVVPLAVTHAELGHLVGAQRSTVTLALKELAGRGSVQRRDDGAFLLTGVAPQAPPEAIGRFTPAGEVVRAAAAHSQDFERLRRRVTELGASYEASARRVADELERARATRARAAELRDQAREDRLRGAVARPRAN